MVMLTDIGAIVFKICKIIITAATVEICPPPGMTHCNTTPPSPFLVLGKLLLVIADFQCFGMCNKAIIRMLIAELLANQTGPDAIFYLSIRRRITEFA